MSSYEGLDRRNGGASFDRRGVSFLAQIKTNWPAITALLAMLGVAVAFAGHPDRLAALEQKQDEQDVLLKFIVCTMGAQGRGYDPAACESYLTPDLAGYLRPNMR